MRFGWQAFVANALVILVVLIGLALFNGAVNWVWQEFLDALIGDGRNTGSLVVGLGLSFLGGLVSLVVGVFIQAVYIRGGLDLVDGHELDAGRLLRTDDLVPLLVTSLLVGLGITVGLILCVLPGIVFAFLSAFSLHYVVDEGLAPVDAIRASIDLVRADLGNALLLWFVTLVVAIAGVLLCGVGVFVSAPVAFLATVHGYRQLRGGYAPAV